MSENINDLRRRIKQQNDILNSPFMRNNDELLNFFCENNTELLWSDVDDNLIDYLNSRTVIHGIEIEDLIRVSKTLQENIATRESELEVAVTPEVKR